MTAKTASIITTANLVRAWIVLGLGALIVMVVFMIQPPASASTAATASPCATSAAAPCPPCTHGQKCIHGQKCTHCAKSAPGPSAPGHAGNGPCPCAS
jgi:hypothetical protein